MGAAPAADGDGDGDADVVRAGAEPWLSRADKLVGWLARLAWPTELTELKVFTVK